jgi:hypothetical protein
MKPEWIITKPTKGLRKIGFTSKPAIVGTCKDNTEDIERTINLVYDKIIETYYTGTNVKGEPDAL